LGKKLFLVIGNGFSIDFLNHLDMLNQIDLVNLFRRGTEVPWPSTGIPGFLSFKHCPNLWNLGARPNMSSAEVMLLIEDIITCVNVHVSKEKRNPIGNEYRPNDIYIHAYKELLQYLKHLFIFYNSSVEKIPKEAESWPWMEFLQYANKSKYYSEIVVVTYNYDIWLERLLNEYEVPFNIGLIENVNPNAKITILKPHGSISFVHKKVADRDSFSIKQDDELRDCPIDEFSVKYDSLDYNYLISALIPPAGESTRFNHAWASNIRREAKKRASMLSKDDEMILCGFSYWHVDRAELGELLISCDPLLNVTMVNPNPSRTITAVLTSMFSNFVIYSGSKTLKEKVACQIS